MSTQTAVGWDIHRKFSQLSVVQRDERGEVRVKERIRLNHEDREAMFAELRRLPPGTPVAMEGSFGWPWIADLLHELGLDPHLGHPPAIKVLAKNEAKADRVDADRLGRFWLRGIFPESYLSTPEVRQLRERLRYRMALVQLRTMMKNRIQAILHRQGVLHNFSDLFGKGGRAFLKTLALPAASRATLDGWLDQIDLANIGLAQVETWMLQNLAEDEVVRWLQTIPGIGLILSHVIRAEIGEIGRFPSRRHLASYCGLAPLANDSADRHGRRHIGVACNHTLRWAFIEAAGIAARSKKCPRNLSKLHYRLTHGGRVNKCEAKVAVAHELCELTYVIWKKGEPYREPPAAPASSAAR
ncbi:MAG: IS110 family transposase [Pirellulales bacterium]